jgi:UDP-glucose 4-epimerase
MSRLALVTGGAGFIGSHLVAHLLQAGWRVRVLDNFTTGARAHLPPQAHLEVCEGDVRVSADCLRATAGADTVFHLAALVSVVESVANPALSHEVNVTGTLNILLAARDQKVRRVVFSSSTAVYGDAATIPTEETQPFSPQSPYAAQKVCGELYGNLFHTLYGLEFVALRYFNVFWPRQSPHSDYAAVIPRFLWAAMRGQSPVVYGNGHQTRDFVSVENVVEANRLAATTEGVSGQAFNIASGRQTSLLELLAALELLAGRALTPRFEPPRAGEVRHSGASIAKAQQILGYHPVVSLEEGLRRAWDALRREAEG